MTMRLAPNATANITLHYILGGQKHTIRWRWGGDGSAEKRAGRHGQAPTIDIPDTYEEAMNVIETLRAAGAVFVPRHEP